MLNLYHLFFNEIIFLDSTEIFSIRHCDRETLSTAGCILLVLSRGDILIWRPKPQQLPDRNTAVGSRIRSSWVNVYAIWDTLTSGQRYPPQEVVSALRGLVLIHWSVLRWNCVLREFSTCVPDLIIEWNRMWK